MRKRGVLFSILSGTIILFGAALLFHSCSSGGGGSGGAASSGTVALYVTDDMSDNQRVIATIDKVTLVSTGTGTTCDVLTTPTTINIADLANVLQLLNVASCQAVPFNRLQIVFEKSVELMDKLGNQSSCSFTSFKDDNNRPNVLQCNGTTCTLDINGAVNLLANPNSKVALDFKLKDFDVDVSNNQCSVTLKVSPIHVEEVEHLGHHEAITGLVSNLTTSTDTFDLTKRHMTFHVLYSGITSSQQPGLNDLLLRAEQDGLKTQVTASTLDFDNKTLDAMRMHVEDDGPVSALTSTIDASKILVKVEGVISALTSSTTTTFTLSYDTGKTIDIDFSKATVRGTLANNAQAEVKLFGFDSTSADFLAALVEVEFEASCPNDDRRDIDSED